jgi:hypothetical protein
MWTIAKTLAQDVIWITQDGRRVLIAEMAQSHRLNTHAYLLRRAAEIHEHVRWLRVRATLNEIRRLSEADQLEGAQPFIEIEMDPERWIRATPFMIALEKAIRDHGAEDGEVIDVAYEGWVDVVVRRLIG